MKFFPLSFAAILILLIYYASITSAADDDSTKVAEKDDAKEGRAAKRAGNRTLEIEKKLEKGWADKLVDNDTNNDDVDVEEVNSVTPDTDLFLHSNGSDAAAEGEVRENATDTELVDGMIEIDDDAMEEQKEKKMKERKEKVKKTDSECGKGWHLYNETQTCFKVVEMSHGKSDWMDALLACGDNGGATLAIIDSQFELKWIQEVPGIRDNLWTGSTDAETEGLWKTTENGFYKGPWPEIVEAKKGSNQAKNESMSDSEKKQDSEGDSEVRDCQVLVTLSNGELSVFEDDCTQGADGALCERPTLAQTPICPPMWYLFNGMCYQIEMAAGTWGDAKAHCSERNSILAAPQSELEFRFLLRLGAGEGCWLGVADISVEGDWLTLDNQKYIGPWGPQEPNSYNGDEDCLAIQDSNDTMVIGDQVCEFTGTCAICSRAPENTISVEVTTPVPEVHTTVPQTTPLITTVSSSTEEPNDPHCPRGWHFFDFTCILFKKRWGNFYDAERVCNSLGGILMSIDSEEEAEFVVKHGRRKYWIGANKRGHLPTHINTDATTYTGPKPYGGDNSDKVGLDCIYVDKDPHERKKTLVAQECKTPGNGFVCEQPAKMLEGDVDCGPFWTYYKNHCFYINKNQFTWQQAKESCEYIQSRLAYPNSTEDVIFFQQIGAQHEYWVGGNDQEQEGLWKTETDQVYQGPWANGYPKADRTENCMQIQERNSKLDVVHTQCKLNGTGAVCRKDAPIARTPCPPGFYMYEGLCFKLLSRVGTRAAGAAACEVIGTRLAVPYHLGFLEFFENLGGGARVWLGPTDRSFEGTWINPRGTRFTAEDIWAEGEPSGNRSANCMIIKNFGGCLGVGDEDCEFVGSGGLCEFDPSEGLVEPKLHPPDIQGVIKQDPYCAPTWTSFQGSCYKIVESHGDFYSGILACQEEGGILAVIGGPTEKNFIVDLGAAFGFWVGSTDEGHEGEWLTSDGGYFIEPWGPDQPDNGGAESGKPENCMMMIDFGIGSYLADVPCDTMGNGSVCERNVLEFWENDNDTSTLSPFDFFDGVQVSDCPSGEWHSSGGNCYLFLDDELSYYQSQLACAEEGGNLAIPADVEDLEFLMKTMDTQHLFWAGIIDDEKQMLNVDSSNHTKLDAVNIKLLTEEEKKEIVNETSSDKTCYLVGKDEKGIYLKQESCLFINRGALCERKKYKDSEFCPRGWFYRGTTEECYFREPDKLSWFAAQARCASYGANLVAPSGIDEIKFLVSIGAKSGDWLGFKDFKKEGQFEDQYGKVYDGPWAKGQPRNVNDEDCMNLYFLNGTLGINDYECNGMPDSLGAMCVMKRIPTSKEKSSMPKCENGWTLAEGQCYKTLKGRWDYKDAADACAEKGATLAYARNHAENFLILRMGKNNYWLGGSDAFAEGTWESMDGLPFSGVWGDGGETNADGSEDCMNIQNGSVAAVQCDYMGYGAICRKAGKAKSQFCPTGWSLYNDQCFVAVPKKLNWEEAKAECDSLEAEMGDTPDAETSAFIVSIGGVPGYWLGVQDNSAEGKFKSSNGTDMATTFFGSASMENTDKLNCARMTMVNNIVVPQLKDCGERNDTRGVICVRDSSVASSKKWCPQGWKFYYGNCYRVFNRPVTWNQARDGCETYRARLAYPETTDDVKFFVETGACPNMYLGATDIGSEGEWMTLDGEVYKADSPWLPGEPNNNGTNKNFVIGRGHTQEQVGEDCLAMRHRKSLEDKTDSEGNPVTPYGADDVDCDVKMDCFICTRPAGTLHDYELCPQGWSFYKDSCYIPLKGNWDWVESRDHCTLIGANMAYPDDEDELEFLLNEGLQPNFFMGVDDVKFETAWTNSDGKSYEGPWGPGRPDNKGKVDEDCMMLKNFGNDLKGADDVTCSTVGKGVMCKRLVLKEPDCPDGWTGFRENCYKISGGNWTWMDGKEYCESFGAMMAFPQDQEDLEYFLSLGASAFYWLGSSDKDNEGTWVNLDGTNYEGPWGNKKHERPNDQVGNEDCMNLVEAEDEMFVNDDDCDFYGRGVVCLRKMGNHPSCPVGWYLYGGKCYSRQLGLYNYSDAVNVCHSYNSELASLWDIGQLDFALSFGTGFGTWLGSDDSLQEETYITDRGYIYPGPWRHGQPDGKDEEGCMILWQFGTSCVGVADTRCDFPGTGALCEFIPPGSEYELPPTTELPVSTQPENPCEQDWEFSGSSCYRVFNASDLEEEKEGKGKQEKMGWFDSLTLCGQFGAHAVSIQTEEELDFIETKFNATVESEAWTGLSSYLRSENSSFSNVDLRPIKLQWTDLELLRTKQEEFECLTMKFDDSNKGELESALCSAKKPQVICEKRPGTASMCSRGNSLFLGYCYKKFNDMDTWNNATIACDEAGGSLAVVSTSSHKLYLDYLADNDPNVWLGASYSHTARGWINSDKSKGEKEVLGSPDREKGSCLSIQKGDLEADDCQKMKPYICQTIGGTGQDPRCPHGWVAAHGSCYKGFENQKLSWFQAIDFCFTFGAHPTALGSIAELQTIFSFAKGDLWIGADDLKVDGRFRNIDDTVVEAEWFTANAYNPSADCLKISEIDENTVMTQSSCSQLNGVMCEKSMTSTKILGCPSGYLRFHEACYKKELSSVNWHQAVELCESIENVIAAPNSEAELNFIAALGKGEKLWLGSTDLYHEDLWINVDRSEYFGQWMAGQPDNNDGEENCMKLDRQQKDYAPMDAQCDTRLLGTICKMFLNEKDKRCPYGWQEFEDSCYKNSGNHWNGTWYEAAVRCYHHEGYLASVNNLNELNFTRKQSAKDSWLGTSTFLDDTWANFDNTDYNVTNIRREVGALGAFKRCLMLTPEVIEDEEVTVAAEDCSKVAPYECEIPPRRPTQGRKRKDDEDDDIEIEDDMAEEKQEKQEEPKCPKHYMHFYGRCYKFAKESVKWDEAQRICQREGGFLAVPNSKFELDYLSALAQEYPFVFLGVSDVGHEMLWTGVDGSQYKLSWGSNQPDNCCSGENCMAFSYESGENEYAITDVSCTQSGVGYICEQLDSDTKKNPDCPKGWIPYEDDLCVLVRSLEDVSWRDAGFGCSYFGGSLLKLTDEAMLEFLFESGVGDLFWLGAHDHGNETFWVNMDGTSYVGPWAKGQPNNEIVEAMQLISSRRKRGTDDAVNNPDVESMGPLSGEQCAIIDQGQVYDFPCEFKSKGYICERPRKGLPPCPINMVFFEGHCYQSNYIAETWAEAESRCTQQNGYLATINSLTELLFTKDFVNFEQEVWLGASDTAEEGLWVNADGTPFNRDLFMEGEPDNYADSENCLILTKKRIEVGSDDDQKEYITKYGIADTHCTTDAKASICEFERR